MIRQGHLREEQLPTRLPPGPSLVAERQTARMVMRPLGFLAEMRERFGDVFTVRVVDEEPWVVLADPEAIATVFKAPADLLHAGEAREILRRFLGESSVMLLDEGPHMEQRRLLLPPFSGDHVARHGETMRRAALQALSSWPLGREEKVAPLTRAIALDVILRAVFGVAQSDRLEPLRTALQDVKIPQNARESAAPAFRETMDVVDELLFAEIAERSGEGGGTGDDVLSLLLTARHEDGSPMSRTEIRDELMTLLAAGYETTATTLAWALDQLARNPEALARVEAEADEGGGPYTEAAIKETLRIRPALPLIVRVAKAPFELGRYLLPPGTKILPAILLLHHRPDIYPEPDCFRPERFLDRQPDPNTWLPFGGGLRRCIGARFAMYEMGVVLSTILSQVTIRPAAAEPEAMRRRDITLTPARGARLVLERR